MTSLEDLRKVGVRRVVFTDAGLFHEVEFFALAPQADTSPSMPKHLELGAPEECPCGHDETSHNGDGMCLQGCDAQRCIEEGARP